MKSQLTYENKINNLTLQPDTYSTVSRIHKYWAKKPSNIINDYIRTYTKKNDIILDPFCGSGIALLEAFNSKRKSIGIDINPIAFLICKGILTKIDIEKIENEFLQIEKSCKKRIDSFYMVKRNQKTYVGTHFVWKNGKLDEVRYKNGKSMIAKPTNSDIILSKSFQFKKIKKYLPKDRLFDNSKINSNSKLKIYDLFTPRNATALAIILDRINQIKDRKIRDIFRLCFSATLGQASKMVFVINNSISENEKKKLKIRKLGSWIIGYWIPKEHFELNAWNCFATRYMKLVNSKKLQQQELEEPQFVNDFRNLKKGNILLINKSAIEGLKKIPSNSVDYIITDPPHGNRIPYLELSQMWNAWLQNKVNYKSEIIISNAKNRDKDILNYLNLLEKTMLEMSRVLKPNRFLTLIFNTHNEKTWNEILNFTKNMGLKIYDISTLNYSHNSVVQEHKEGGLRFDFVLTFKKTSSN